MAVRQYIGARYVPKFYENADNTAEWRSGVAYEPLTIVTYNGNSYTSKIEVPASVGNPSANPSYWISTGIYNEQIEQYRQLAERAAEDAAYATKAARRVSSNLANVGAYRHGDYIPQGGFSDGNYFYQYFYSGTGIGGRLTSFNLTTGAVGTTTACNLYHGNDFVKVGNYVYEAPYDDGAGNGVNKLLRFRLNDLTTVDELDVFNSTGLDCLYGITAVDDETLICALRPYGTNNVNATRLFRYSISSGAIYEIPVNWGAFPYFVSGFPHPIHYFDGILYITGSYENGIYKLSVDDDYSSAEVIDYTSLPFFDNYGSELLELEAVGTIDRYGSKYMLISFTAYEASVIFCAVSLDGEAPFSMCGQQPYAVDDSRAHVNESGEYIFENGTQTYPFKSLRRAINAIRLHIMDSVQLDGNVIYAHTLRNVNTVIYPSGHTFEAALTIVESTVTIGATTFNAQLRIIYASTVMLLGCTYNGTDELTISDGSVVSEAPSVHNAPIRVANGFYRLSSSNTAEALTVACTGNSLLQINRTSTTGITAGGGTTVLTPGTK